MSPERIEDIVAFVHAADARSFTIAAERLGLSRSTVGKRITRLEARLGARLLHRTTRSVTLTDEGATFHGRCTEILEALEAALIANELRDGRLVRILVGHGSEGEPLSVVYPVRRLLPPKVTAFVELLVASWQPRPPWDL